MYQNWLNLFQVRKIWNNYLYIQIKYGEMGHIYLLNIYPHHENVVKLGKAQEFLKRFPQYKNVEPRIIFVYECDNEGTHEDALLAIFRKEFNEKREKGSEYFQWDNIEDMKKCMLKYFMEYDGKVEKKVACNYACVRCGHIFTKISNYVIHANRKTRCSPVRSTEFPTETNYIQKEPDYKCQDCDRIFATSYNLQLHLNSISHKANVVKNKSA
jgi:DNA-directed RNA polymerase subunit RPC12/RpoP